jgi:hypothetical protein
MPYIGRAPTSTATKIEDADQDTKIQVEESSDEDTIRFDIAGAEDFTMSANSLNVLTGSVLALPDGAVGTPSITNTGDLNTGVYFPAADTVGVVTGGTEQFRFGSNPIPGGSKNLIINGGMTVAQRGTSFTITPNASGGDTDYTLDRWAIQADGVDSDYTVTQVTLTPGTDEPYDSGFRTSIKVDCDVADGSPGATDTMALQQRLEGQNVQVLAYGDAQAKSSTVSFWHKHTKTGTNTVTINASSGTKWVSKQYTQSVSNTWEYATVTIPADTALAPANDAANRLQLMFGISVGSTYTSGSEAAWGTTNGNYFPGQVNNMDSTSNNFEIAGVQWEVGSVATDFAHEDIGTTLQKCQRYYVKWDGPGDLGMSGVCRSTSTGVVSGLIFPVQMRTTPTITYPTFNTIDSSASGVDATVSTSQAGPLSATCSVASGSGYTDGNGLFIELKSGTELTASAEL